MKAFCWCSVLLEKHGSEMVEMACFAKKKNGLAWLKWPELVKKKIMDWSNKWPDLMKNALSYPPKLSELFKKRV